MNKYFEFFDTWFFILRKSSRQVTFLHLFHHSSITVVVGTILPFDYNGDMYLPIFLNSTNHMLVYLHYLLATLGLTSWWSSYITSLQLIQFILIFAQSLMSYRLGPQCGSPDFAKVLMIVYMGSMVALFSNFFLQKYILRRPLQSVDTMGVIKRPVVELSTASQYFHGNGLLDGKGEVTITLPDSFPDISLHNNVTANNITGGVDGSPSASNKRRSRSQQQQMFDIQYSLTPIGAAMPMLFIKREVSRLTPSNIKTTPHAMIDSAQSVDTEDTQSNKSTATHRKKNKHGKHSGSGAQQAHSDQDTPQHSPRLSTDEPLRPRQTSADDELVFSCFWPVDHQGRGAKNSTDDTVTRNTLNNANLSVVVPLSFTISGGVPHGKVSWTVVTVPLPRSGEGRKLGGGGQSGSDIALNQESHQQRESNSSSGQSHHQQQHQVSMKQTEDWRAINY
eukprot:gene22798-28960_t